MIALPDVNVLLALAWAQHPHHNAAHTWFTKSASDGWATCILTQSAFVRLSMNAHAVTPHLDCANARNLLATLIAHREHRYIADAAPVSSPSFDPIVPAIRGYRQVTDATLLHFARSHGLKLITFDRAATAISPWPEAVELLPP